AVLLSEAEQDADDCLELPQAALFLAGDLVDEREQRLLDEFDQPLEHLRLAAKMTVERGLRNVEAGREGGGGDPLAGRMLQHLRQRLQDLVLALPRFRRHVRSPLSLL